MKNEKIILIQSNWMFKKKIGNFIQTNLNLLYIFNHFFSSVANCVYIYFSFYLFWSILVRNQIMQAHGNGQK